MDAQKSFVIAFGRSEDVLHSFGETLIKSQTVLNYSQAPGERQFGALPVDPRGPGGVSGGSTQPLTAQPPREQTHRRAGLCKVARLA